MKKKIKKLRNAELTFEILHEKWKMFEGMGYPKAKWIEFSEILIKDGYQLFIYEAKQTASKYITVTKDNKSFKVRFSNHKPIAEKELNGDCDFFVGVTHTGVRNTTMALNAVRNYFINNTCTI